MCGIIGFIGASKNQKVSHELTTALLQKTESRGDDATGFWASSVGESDKTAYVLYHKEPKKSTEFVYTDMWKKLSHTKTNILIGHCRRSSQKGSEHKNKNNHPFVSQDKKLALVHNGSIPEFDALKTEYEIFSQCDSEILLRMIEEGSYYNREYVVETLSDVLAKPDTLFKNVEGDLPLWSHRLMGMRDIFSRINYGAMAVAAAEQWNDGTRALWLFRNSERPLHIVDLREKLGQFFIFSLPHIWREAVKSCHLAKGFVEDNEKLVELPDEYIWLFTVDKNNSISIRKWELETEKKYQTSFVHERPSIKNKPKITIKKPKLISCLNEDDEVIDKKKTTSTAVELWKNGKTKQAKASVSQQASCKQNNGVSNSSPAANWDYVTCDKTSTISTKGKKFLSQKDLDVVESMSDDIVDTMGDMVGTLRSAISEKGISPLRFDYIKEAYEEIRQDARILRDLIEDEIKNKE